MNKKIFYSSVAALLIFPALSLADEPEEEKIKTLDEVVVTATKIEETRRDVPNSVILYDEYDIEELPVTGIGELLANDPGIDWRTKGDFGGAAQEIHIRGMNGLGTQVFINGVNLNSPSLGLYDVGRLPLNNIGNIEVVKGSGSLLYGTGAMGGTISIFTKRPTPNVVDLKVEGGAGTNQTYHLGFENGLYFDNKFGYYLTANYDGTDGFRSNSDLDHKDFSLNLVLDQSEKFDLSLYGQLLDREAGVPGVKPPEGTETFYVDNVAVYNSESASLLDRQADKDGLVVLTANSRPSERLNITLLGNVSSQDSHFYQRYVSMDSVGYTLPGLESWTTNTIYEVEGDVDIDFSDKGDLLIGAEYKSYDWENESIDLDGSGDRLEDSRKTIDEDLHSTGIYGELHYRFFSSLKVLAGLRYEDNSGFGTETLPRFGLVATPHKNTVLKISSGKHFRAPTPNELFWPEDLYSKGNPDLRPETGWHSDVTWEQSIKEDRIFFAASYFHWDIDDKIDWGLDENWIYTPQNLSSYTGDGLEAAAKLHIHENVILGISYTFLDVTEESYEDNLERRADYTPRDLFRSDITYFSDFGSTVSAIVRYTGDRVYYNNFEAKEYVLDDYWTFDMKFVQQFKDHYYLTVLGTNLFDQDYQTYLGTFFDNMFQSSLAGYPGAGRSVFVKLEYRY
jgi:iron complex outermembrane receptor protein